MISYEKLSKEELIDLLKQKDLSQKFGLVWEDEKEPETVVQECCKKDPVLVPVEELKINNGSSLTHTLIEGDNYCSLKILEKTHANGIDFIYIDPPYNTGAKNDFNYNDCRIDKCDKYSHSKWLNFMHKRLLIAKNLLKESGVIFISIGEKEVSTLNLLCCEIFGETNFLTMISRISKNTSDKGGFFAPSCDYILCFAKNKDKLDSKNFFDEVDENLYPKSDENGRYRDDVAFYQSSLDPMRGCVNQRYYIKCPDGSLVIPKGNVFPEKKEDAAFVKPASKADKVWRWSYETYLKQKDLIVFKETKNSPLVDENGHKAKFNIYTKSYLSQRQNKGTKPRNFLTDKKFLNRKGTDYLKTMGLNFSYSKPKELIEHLLSIVHLEKNAIVLDFFAGSGTTAEAVLRLNDVENASRTFILCTNNEDNICSDICYPRIKNVINGYTSTSGEAFKGLGGNLNYYRTDFSY